MQLSAVNYAAMTREQAQSVYYRRLEILRYSQAAHASDTIDELFRRLDSLTDGQIFAYMARRLAARKRGPAKGSVGLSRPDVTATINDRNTAKSGSVDTREHYQKQASDRALAICKEKLKAGERVDYSKVHADLLAGRIR